MHKAHHRFFTINIGLALLALCVGIATAADAPPVSGYTRWFDASKLVGVADGASVSTLNDLSGNGANATVPAGNAAPTFVANAGTGTGLGALYFPKNSGPSNSGALRFTRDSSIRTVFSVFKGNSFLLTDASTYHFHRPTDDTPTSPLWEVAHGYASASIRNGSTCVNGMPVNGTSFAMPTNAYNGFNLVEVVTTGPVSADSFNKDRTYHAGNQYQAEVIIYDRALSDAERLQVRNYLTAKWFAFDSSTAPVVTSTVPAAGCAIDTLNPSVSVTFNKPMNTASVQAAFSMDGLSGSFSWSESTLTFKPALQLRPNTSYTVSIGTGAQAVDGSSLAAPYSFVVSTPSGLVGSALTVTCDNAYDLYLNGILVGSGNSWTSAQKYSNIALVPGKNVIAVKGVDTGGVAALLAEMTVNGRRVGTSRGWKVTLAPPANWADPTLDDTSWASATEYGAYGVTPWNTSVSNMPTDTPARWIWSSNNNADNTVYLRWTVDTSTVSSAPTNLTFSHIADRVVAFTWQPAVGANPSDYYEVYRNGAFIAVAGTPSYRDTTLTPLTQYSYTVRSVNALGGTSPFSAPAVATTLSAPPIGTGTGLQGKYYATKDLSNRVLVRTDAQVAFDWGNGAPATGVGADNFSVRWEGQILPRYSEQFTFYTLSDDGVRLWVDGQLLVNDWNTHAPTENKGLITLQAGQKYDIRMEYFESTGGAVAKLFWESASQIKELVPTSQLYPAVLAEVNLITSAESAVSPAWVEGRNVSDAVSVKFSVNGGAAQDVVRESAIQWYADTASAQGLPYGIPLDKDAPTALSVTSLAASTQVYYYRIRATNSVGDSVYSNEATATGQAAAALLPVGPPGYIYCAAENQTFTLPGTCDVAYGANGKFNYLTGLSGTITFNNATFGDPIVGTAKAGFYKPAADLPAAPSNLCATVQSANHINLTWTDNATNETGFKLERKLGATGAWAQIATLDANAASYSDTANGCGSTQIQNYSLVWTPTKLNGKSWSEDEIVIRVNDSLLFTVESAIPNIQVKLDANGDGTVDYSGSANMKFPWKYSAAGHYIVTAWIGTEKCGSLTVTVMDANLHAPVACEVGYQREKFIEVTPLDSAAKVSFVGNDPALLGVSVKGPAVDEGISGLKLYMMAVKRGTPILQARVNGKCGPLVKQQEVDEFTLELPAAAHLVAFHLEGGAVGTSTVVIRPFIPNLELELHMFAHRSTFVGGQTSIVINSSAFERIYDETTDEEIGTYGFEIEQPDGEQSYCIDVALYQASSQRIRISNIHPTNGMSCIWDADVLVLPLDGQGELALYLFGAGQPPDTHTLGVDAKAGPKISRNSSLFCSPADPEKVITPNPIVSAIGAVPGKYKIRISNTPSPEPAITIVGLKELTGNGEWNYIRIPFGDQVVLRATPDQDGYPWPEGFPKWQILENPDGSTVRPPNDGEASASLVLDKPGKYQFQAICGTNLANQGAHKEILVEVVGVGKLLANGKEDELNSPFTETVNLEAQPNEYCSSGFPSGYPRWKILEQPLDSHLQPPMAGEWSPSVKPDKPGRFVFRTVCGDHPELPDSYKDVVVNAVAVKSLLVNGKEREILIPFHDKFVLSADSTSNIGFPDGYPKWRLISAPEFSALAPPPAGQTLAILEPDEPGAYVFRAYCGDAPEDASAYKEVRVVSVGVETIDIPVNSGPVGDPLEVVARPLGGPSFPPGYPKWRCIMGTDPASITLPPDGVSRGTVTPKTTNASYFAAICGDYYPDDSRCFNGKGVYADGVTKLTANGQTSPPLVEALLATDVLVKASHEHYYWPEGYPHWTVKYPTGSTVGVPANGSDSFTFKPDMFGAYEFTATCGDHPELPDAYKKVVVVVVPHFSKLEFIIPDSDQDYIPDAHNQVADVVRIGLWDRAFSAYGLRNFPNEEANFVGSDLRRFYLRAYDSLANTDPNSVEKIHVEWCTVAGNGTIYDDNGGDPAFIELVETGANTGVFVSRALMIVKDDIDHEVLVNDGITGSLVGAWNLNFRLRRIAYLDDDYTLTNYSTRAEYTDGTGKTLTAEVPIFKPEERRKVKLNVINFQDTARGIQAVPAATIDQQVATIRESFSQAAIDVEVNYKLVDIVPPTDAVRTPTRPVSFDVRNVIYGSSYGRDASGTYYRNELSADEVFLTKLARCHLTGDGLGDIGDEMVMVVIPHFVSEVEGFGRDFSDGSHPSLSYAINSPAPFAQNFIIIDSRVERFRYASSHLLGHLMTNESFLCAYGVQPDFGELGDYAPSSKFDTTRNLMYDHTQYLLPPSYGNELGPKRLWSNDGYHPVNQIGLIRQSRFVKER